MVGLERTFEVMEIESLQSLESTIPPIAWRRLEAFMGSVTEGQPENLVTPFLPKEWREDELGYAKWYLRNIATTELEAINALEAEESERFGPFSIRLPFEERRESVEEYFNQMEGRENVTLRLGFEAMRRWLPRNSLYPDALDTSYGAMPKDSNLGLPWFTRDRELAKEYLMRAIRVAGSGYMEDIYPAVLGWRGQPNGTQKPKQRVVWMEDHLQTIIGLSIQAPMLRALRGRPEFAAWNSLDVVDRTITQILDRDPSREVLSIDFSGFDRRLVKLLIHYSFELLRWWFVSSAKPRIDWLERQMLTVGLVTPIGIYTGRIGGMPSGDALTNLVDSLSQLLAMIALSSSRTVLGDDGVYRLIDDLTLADVSEYLLNNYGMVISTSKGSLSANSVSYLQRLHLREYRRQGLCVGVRSLVRTWNGVCHQERGHRDLPPEFYSARAIMQLQNSDKHPRFLEAVRYYYLNDKFARDLDPTEIFRRAGGVAKVESVMGLTGFRFGTELPSKGLNEFRTVQELRKLRGSAS